MGQNIPIMTINPQAMEEGGRVMATPDEIKKGIEMLKTGLDNQAPLISEILFAPLKKHAKDCQCDPCLISIKRRAQRVKAIRRKEVKQGIFYSWSDAFDVCREADQPLIVREIKDRGDGLRGFKGKWKIFPSGRCENLITGEVEY